MFPGGGGGVCGRGKCGEEGQASTVPISHLQETDHGDSGPVFSQQISWARFVAESSHGVVAARYGCESEPRRLGEVGGRTPQATQ